MKILTKTAGKNVAQESTSLLQEKKRLGIRIRGDRMIKKYRTKPVEIEAVEWTGDNREEVEHFVGSDYYVNGALFIETREGDMQASIGDYIIKGLLGEFYPCKPDVFHKKYEVAE